MNKKLWIVEKAYSTVSGSITTSVGATYFKVENGALVFRNSGHPYPETVKVFAAGQWASVEEMKPYREGPQ